MDFSLLYQLRTKKYWWMDALFYFSISLLLATIFSYATFAIKSSLVKGDIEKETKALETVGTETQKTEEKYVLGYRNKIADFSGLFKSHQFDSNVFIFIQDQATPFTWFKQFALDQKSSAVRLTGETDNVDNLSRQVANFEKNKYVKAVTLLNSKLDAQNGKISFNINLSLDQKIFEYSSENNSSEDKRSEDSEETPEEGSESSEGNP